ncbi:hypothetical protein P7K49_038838 [Saguinus oedipus]|uniref:Uncharacterized protein n=1 Tax=Saguinus oedipus TaxID=9490 RepID=A0ABQ9THD2_SAGOE|nr:hypothetical protein P7K49_038838 [Saguinus oedipus]
MDCWADGTSRKAVTHLETKLQGEGRIRQEKKALFCVKENKQNAQPIEIAAAQGTVVGIQQKGASSKGSSGQPSHSARK